MTWYRSMILGGRHLSVLGEFCSLLSMASAGTAHARGHKLMLDELAHRRVTSRHVYAVNDGGMNVNGKASALESAVRRMDLLLKNNFSKTGGRGIYAK